MTHADDNKYNAPEIWLFVIDLEHATLVGSDTPKLYGYSKLDDETDEDFD